MGGRVPEFDGCSRKYASGRSMVYARKGIVATSQPLAANAGLDMLKQGGNAIDAAVAAAACLTVLEPTSNGLGSDAFSIVWTKDKGEQDYRLFGLNASGKAPMAITAEEVRAKGYKTVPRRGWIPVMVPGAPAAWAALNRRFGKLPLEQVLAPAARYAREGYAVTPVISRLWKDSFAEFKESFKDPCFEPWFDHFAPDGHAPAAGETWKSPEMADTLEKIGKTYAEAYYRGELADVIDRFSRETGGYIRKEDLADYEPQWVNPISVSYRGYDVWEIPPNGFGIIALMTLNQLQGFSFDGKNRDDAEVLHKQIESLKLAFEDGKRYVADPRAMTVTVEEMLSPAYAAGRRALIGEEAIMPEAGDPHAGGTVYLCAADEEGNMISYIQSNFNGFGSGIVIPGTGISLQNRGAGFSLDESMENCLAPGKKSMHTIIPGFLTKNGEAVGPFGVMGAFMQPQGHVQVMTNLLDFHMNPQEALDAPRWQWVGGKKIQLEKAFPPEIAEALRARGHEVEIAESSLSFGRGQIIFRNEEGVLCGASEPRADGCAAAW